MRLRCNVESCRHWEENAGPYIGEGGCTLEEVQISDDEPTAAGFVPMCADYEEKE